MSWKFWQKKEAAPGQQVPIEWPTDSFDAVRMLVAFFVGRDGRDLPPFALWRADDAQLTADTERIAEFGSKGLVLAVWFWQFAAIHGDIAARMAQDSFCLLLGNLSDEDKTGEHAEWLLTVIDGARQTFEQMPDYKRTFEVRGETITLTFHWYLALALLTQVQDSPFYGKDSVGDADLNVALCLAYAAKQSQRIWEPMVARIGPFNPASFPSWKWSAKPGAVERHLQRRHNNPLFPRDRQQVTAAEVYYARVKDAQALADVRRGLAGVFEELKKSDLPFDWHEHLNGIRRQLDELYEQLQRAGGDSELEKVWRRMRDHLIATWRAAIGDNPDATDRLDSAEAIVMQGHTEETLWTYQVSGSAETIPPEEFVCSLLSESVEDIIKSVARLGRGREAMTGIRAEALRCVMRALAEGREVPQHRQKLAALGVSI